MATTRLALVAVLAMGVGVVPMMAQQQTAATAGDDARTGVSRPDETDIVASDGNDLGAPVKAAKPSAAVPVTSTTTAAQGGQVYGAYVPYTGPQVAGGAVPAMTEEQADGAVVLSVPEQAGMLREGTLFRARLQERLSTTATAEGALWTAELVEPIEKDGRVVMPIGSKVEGIVTQVYSGRRITGGAGIHLEARSVVLPDGTRYAGHFQLIDTDLGSHTRVNNEGTLKRRDHPKEELAAMGLATGGAAAAGAVIGGGVGAAVGAGIGAGASTIIFLKQDRQEVVPAHTLLVFSLGEAMPLHAEGALARQAMSQRPMGDPDSMVVGVDQ